MLALLVALAATHSDTEQNEVVARDIREARRGPRQRNHKKRKTLKGKKRNKSTKRKPVRGKSPRKVKVQKNLRPEGIDI